MMQILVSACLVGENCKWDGGNNKNQAVLDFMKQMEGKAEFHLICPEQMGGLPTPREASEIREGDGVVVTSEGRDVTAEFLLGADLALRDAKKYECTLAILKERSPSCGSSGIYDGSFTHTRVPGMGKTARLLSDYGIRVVGESQVEMLKEELAEKTLSETSERQSRETMAASEKREPDEGTRETAIRERIEKALENLTGSCL